MANIEAQIEEESYRRVKYPILVQLAVGLGVAVTTIDAGSVNLSLHTLGKYFGVETAALAWLPLLGFLVVTATLLLFGRLSDVLGSKLIFVCGFGVYAAGSLVAGSASSFNVLLAARGLQALGISMLSANSAAILTDCFPPHKRGTVLGINSALVGLGFFIGPIVSGFVIRSLGWRYVFFASVPLCLLALIASIIVLPRSLPAKSRHFDFLGAFLFPLTAICLLLAVNFARSSPLGSPRVAGFAIGAVIAFVAFVIAERRVREPMLELGLFRIRLFSLSLASAFVLFLGLSGQDFLVPLFTQQVLMMDPAMAGTITSVVPFLRMLASWPSGFLSDRFGSRWLSVFGAVLTGVGLFGLSRMDAGTTVPWMIPFLALIGLGTGIFFSPNMHATMAALPLGRQGVAAAALGLRRNLGQSFGVALAAYLLQSGTTGNAASGFQLAFTLQTVFLVVAVFLTFVGGSTVAARRSASRVISS